jgi:trimeric autotransporter adhesin
MNKKIYTTGIAFLLFISLPLISLSQITGKVFRDYNNDGVQQSTNPTEPGEFGVVVKAYDVTNTLRGTVSTNSSGDYSFSAAQAPAGSAIRVEFSVNSGDQPSKRISSNKTNIQFVVAGSSAINIDFAIASKKSFTDNANPYVATTAFTNGNALSSGSNTAGDNNGLYVFPYDLSNDGGTTRRAKNQYMGSVFGLTWQRESRTLLMAAYLKRHASFGPNGIGAIYQTQIDKTGIPSTPSLLLDVTAIGINVGTNPRTTTLPDDPTLPNTDLGVFSEVGRRGIGGIELSVDGRDLYMVNMYEKKIHRINVGNPFRTSFTAANVTGNWSIPDPGFAGTVWHPMALEVHNGKIYVGGISTKETTTAHNIADTANLRGTVYEFNPSTGIFTNVLSFPLTHRRGFTNADYRYEHRNNYWAAWQNNGDISLGGPLRSGLIGSTTGGNATGIYYSQPMLCDIEFDVDGSMILGVRDRFGDQGGYANYFETGNVPGETYRVLATGEVLKAGKSGSVWIIENNGSVTNNGITTTSAGLADNIPGLSGSFPALTGTPWGGPIGPGGGYFYYNQNFTKTGVPSPFNTANTVTAHYTKSNGGIAVYPGYNEVMMSAIDPVNKAYTNGIIRNYNLGSNAGNMSGRMELTSSTGNDPTNFGKAAALGDFELLLDAEAMEIGNLIWQDFNNNGLQDANEPGIAGVNVVLRSPGSDNIYNNANDQVWTVTTDANGNYFFDETIVNDSRRPSSWIGVSSTNSGILPGFEYRIEILETQSALSQYNLTVINSSDDAINSEGVVAGSYIYQVINPGGSTAANSSFSNNYNLDFGFMNDPLPLTLLSFTAQLSTTNVVNLKWETVTEINVSHFEIEKSTDGINFVTAGIVSAKGNTEDVTRYGMNDFINDSKSALYYYRLRSVDIDGKNELSATRIIRVSNQQENISIVIFPNPVNREVRITIPNSWQNKRVVYEIFNASGRIVMRTETASSSQTEAISMSSMASGFYIVRVTYNGQTAQQKIVKQ